MLTGALLLAASPARAGLDTARLEIMVAAPPGASSATVRLRSLDEPALSWTATPGETRALFASVPPGHYSLKAEAAGLEAVDTELRLAPGEGLTLKAVLAPAGSRLVVMDRYRPVLGASFDQDRMRDLPSSGTPWSLLETGDATAILDRIEGGGLAVGVPGLFGIHGSSWTQASYRLGDLDLTDPDRTGTPLFYPDLGALQAFDIASGQAPADLGGAGPTLQLVPRRPAAGWRGSVDAGFIDSGLQSGSSSPVPAIARFGDLLQVGLVASGPLVKDRLGLLISGTLVRSQRYETDETASLPGNLASLTAHFVYTASLRDEVRVFALVQGVTLPYAGRARFTPPDVAENDRFGGVYGTWERRAAKGTAWSASAGYGRGTFDPQTQGQTPGAPVERLTDGPVPDLFPGTGQRDRWQLTARVAPGPRDVAGGRHAAQLGFEVSRTTSITRPEEPPSLTLEAVNGLPARVWDYGWAGPESRWGATEVGVWATDQMTYGPVSLDAGLRFQVASASTQTGPGAIDWSSFSPRVALRWRIIPRLAAFAGLARYTNRLPLPLLAFGDPTATQGLVYRADDGTLVARAGPGFPSSIDPNLEPPHADEIVLGLDTRLGQAWAIRFLGIRREEKGLIASVNVGVPLSAYSVTLVPDPGGNIIGPEDDQLLPIYDRRPESFGQDRYLLTNLAEANALHEGLELLVQGTIRRRLQLWLGATAYRSEGPGANRNFHVAENDQGVVGELREDPNALTYAEGRLFFDRAFTIKIGASWHAPHDVRLGVAARYQDGQPFARLVIAPDLNQGPEAIQAIPRGRSRFTYTLTLDARIEKGFSLGRRARLAAVAQVFNLLDQANEVQEDVATGPAFRTETAVQPPRAFSLGLRFDF